MTEIKYYNYICDDCTRKQKEDKKELDLYLLEQFRIELDKAIASGDQEMIDLWTKQYNSAKANFERKYGGT